jgi:NAD(P)-dependent dehydrogenase (short-subunit alcohol dehydrogenase family)
VNYFVTGATGFIGRHLVRELLARDGRVFALVREGSRGKIEDLARRLGAEDRIVAVPGDLSKPALGVEGFDEPIDHLIHLAAIYDIEASEEAMERANVDGTRNVVDFANAHGVGRFHHVSSIAVAGRFQGLFREDMFDEGQKLPHAYHRTKFESERVAREEVQGKLLVYRPGIVIGHSETGEMDKVDGPYYFFKLIQRLRHALPSWFPLIGPEGRKAWLVPVDFVAKAIDRIAHLPDEELPGDTFHLVDPNALTVGQAINEFAKVAHAPQMSARLDPEIFGNLIPKPVRKGLLQVPTIRKTRETLLRDLGIPPAAWENRDFLCDFDARDTQRALRGTGVAVPPLSTYAARVWDYWERNLDPDLFRERSLSSVVEGKRVVVTGASSGIGRELALKLGEAGAEVILVSRTREKLEEVARLVEDRGGKGHVHPADLSDLDDIDRVAQEILAEHGGVDILVNNAGKSIRRSVHYQYDRFHDFERTMRLNYFGSLKLILAFLPGMRERKSGHVINVSSYSVQMNTPRFGAYAASKSALDTFCRCIAAEMVDDNVQITTVYMPLVRTPMIAPTSFYRALPALEPEEAGQMLADAMIDRPKRVATRLGTFSQVIYAVAPKAADVIANGIYKLFPERDPSKPKEAPQELPAGAAAVEAEKSDDEVSAEGMMLAYLARGVYF